MTISELIKAGRERLSESKTALLDSEVLLQHVLGVEKPYLLMNKDEAVDDDLSELFAAYVQRVAEGEPVAHITREKEFFELNFFVDERVLIPRPETEYIVDLAIKYLSQLSEQDEERRFKVMDVGTGSGNIPISIANYFQSKDWDILDQILALEVSEKALEVAQINSEQHSVENLLEFAQSDLLEVLEGAEYFDVITANLPYIGEEKYRFVEADVQQYEPNVALFGGKDGLQLYRRMFDQMQEKGVRFGILVGEFGFAQSEDLAKLLNEYFGDTWSIEADMAGIDRFFIVNGHAR